MWFRWLLFCALLPPVATATDWPEWRGEGRRGEWNETGILQAFPADGLDIRWRVPVNVGYSGPAVAAGRVYVTDYRSTSARQGVERILCLDEKTGKTLWTREWRANYASMSYGNGPRATPTVDGDRVYVLGAAGMLVCLNTADGSELWRRELQKDYRANMPIYGFAGAPLVDGERLICLVGGEPDAKIVALNKMTGKEIWRALSGDSATGYSPPFLIEHTGRSQLIQWHPRAVVSLEPATGEILWEQPFRVHLNVSVATPVKDGARLLVSSEFNGSLMLDLDDSRPAARMVWKGKSDSAIRSDGLHALISTPVIRGDHIYGIGVYGHFRCIRADTGERVWETFDVTGGRARWAAGFIVRNGERYFINNDAGELIIAMLSPDGYKEISRTRLLNPTSYSGNRRAAGAVNWSHPAYANRHIFARNDEEIVCASLEAR